MPGDVTAHGFSHELDGHPALDWMGDDWVTYVTLGLLEDLRSRDPNIEMTSIKSVAPPDMELSAAPSGTVSRVTLRLRVEVALESVDTEKLMIRGVATFAGPEPLVVSFEPETPEQQLITVLREARDYVARTDNDFLWSSWEDTADALGEIDGYIAELELRPVRASTMSGMFAPTGPMHELAVSSGWSGAFSDLADRFDAIRMSARDTWACVICWKDAGTIELHENGDVQRDSFTSRLTQKLTAPEPFGRLWDAIAGGDTAAVFAVDPEFAPWWCPECKRIYCGDHWHRWDVFDDGFHDSIRGRCPQGHERMLED